VRKISLLALSLSVVIGFAANAAAHEVQYEAFMDGPSENPPTPSLGTGYSLVTIDLDVLTMRVEAEFQGLTGTTTLAHIHCCTNPPGTVGFATTEPSFPGFPLGVTSGTYDQTFDLTQASTYRPSFITANGGTIDGAMNALLNGLAAGQAYFNIHTSFRSGGEIRGFFEFVPEPSTFALMMLGAVGLLGRRRR
jgi:hypothetical protein